MLIAGFLHKVIFIPFRLYSHTNHHRTW